MFRKIGWLLLGALCGAALLLGHTGIVLANTGGQTSASATPKSVVPPGSDDVCRTNGPFQTTSNIGIVVPFGFTDTVCVGKHSNQITSTAILVAQTHGSWGSCSIQVNLYDATTGSNSSSAWNNCGNEPHGNYAGPSVTAKAGHQYHAWTNWRVNYLGTQLNHSDDSPVLNN